MIRKKKHIEENVWEKALERTRRVFDDFEEVFVLFSGGKDSTAVLNVALQVAEEKGRLPLRVVFYDEEAIHPPTVEYVERIMKDPRVDLEWYCLPVAHRNACSNEQPYWYCWNEEEKDKWVRPMPEWGIKDHPRFKKGMSIPEFSPKLAPMSGPRTCAMMGIRSNESMTRYRLIAMKKNDHFLTKRDRGSNFYRAYPIYDWHADDVWTATKKFGWDYNRTYDVFNQTRAHKKFETQRVCPPFGEEPLRGLWIYAECFPEMWHKMLGRVEGVGTAWRYANTDLYSKADDKPTSLTYRQYLDVILDTYGPSDKRQVKINLNAYVTHHSNKTPDPIPEDDNHPYTGVSWRFMCKMAIRGDFKGRGMQLLTANAKASRERLGLTEEQVIERYAHETSA